MCCRCTMRFIGILCLIVFIYIYMLCYIHCIVNLSLRLAILTLRFDMTQISPNVLIYHIFCKKKGKQRLMLNFTGRDGSPGNEDFDVR